MVRDEVNFFLEHADVAFVVDAVLMLEVAFDLFFRSDEKPGGDIDELAAGAEMVFALLCFE